MSSTSSVTLHTSLRTSTHPSPLPPLLQTPLGLALLELQGTINLPSSTSSSSPSSSSSSPPTIPIGRLDFPLYSPSAVALDLSSTAWMRQVYLYVGRHQRLTGEVKKLAQPVGVLRRRLKEPSSGQEQKDPDEETAEELEVVDVVRYKLVFSSRPEPVTQAGEGV